MCAGYLVMIDFIPQYVCHPEGSDFVFILTLADMEEIRRTGIVPKTAMYQSVTEHKRGKEWFYRVPPVPFEMDIPDQSLINLANLLMDEVERILE